MVVVLSPSLLLGLWIRPLGTPFGGLDQSLKMYARDRENKVV